MEDKIRVLKVEPGKAPKAVEMDNTLRAMQEMVGGYIQLVPFEKGACVVCNEDGKLIGLEVNRRFGHDILVGTFFVAGDDGGEDFCSLTDEQIEKYSQQFKEPLIAQNENIRFGFLAL